MLEQPGAERVTTAALAARLDVSEAALYRHFASKAQMFEGLIEFIEQSVFGLVNQLGEREPDAMARSRKLVALLLQFGEKNPGMTRVMVGDALVYENERLQQRMNLFFDKIESALRQNLREVAWWPERPHPPWMRRPTHRWSRPSAWADCSALPAADSSARPTRIWNTACACCCPTAVCDRSLGERFGLTRTAGMHRCRLGNGT
ncbi:Synthetically lethal with a defective Min system protein A [Hydrogenophaga sp. T4]|nr:Synthetically lethal with a defective Min system protein A [Hydrogenophaga sp. T4]